MRLLPSFPSAFKINSTIRCLDVTASDCLIAARYAFAPITEHLIDLDQAHPPRVSMVGLSTQEVAMRKISIRQVILAIAVFAIGWFASPGWSPGEGPSLAVESAQARVGRPLTPMSVA